MNQQPLTVEQRYALLKTEFDEIDKKYNRALNDIELDFPDSLGLTKLTFTPLEQQQLQELAENYYQGVYGQKIADYTQGNLDKQRQNRHKLAQQEMGFAGDCQSLLENYNKKRLAFINKALQNCIEASSIYHSQLNKLLAEYTKRVEKAQQSHQQAVDTLNQQLQLLQQLLSQTTEHLQQQKDAKIEERLLKLNQDQQDKSDSVTKYNNSVDKQEADYQVKIQKAYATVTASEQRRALEAINLLATVGVSGVERLKAEEKVPLAKEFFATLSRAEAQDIFNNDVSLEYHFASYYGYMQEYVNNLPA